MKAEKIFVYTIALCLFILAACENNPIDRINPAADKLNGQRSASDSAGLDSTRGDSTGTIPIDSIRIEPVWPDTVKTDTIRIDSVKLGPIPTDSIRTDSL